MPCACLLSCFSRVWLFSTLWTVARQIPLSMGVLQASTLELAMPSSRGSSWPTEWTCISYVSCIAGGFFTSRATRETPTHLTFCIYYFLHCCRKKSIDFTRSHRCLWDTHTETLATTVGLTLFLQCNWQQLCPKSNRLNKEQDHFYHSGEMNTNSSSQGAVNSPANSCVQESSDNHWI